MDEELMIKLGISSSIAMVTYFPMTLILFAIFKPKIIHNTIKLVAFIISSLVFWNILVFLIFSLVTGNITNFEVLAKKVVGTMLSIILILFGFSALFIFPKNLIASFRKQLDCKFFDEKLLGALSVICLAFLTLGMALALGATTGFLLFSGGPVAVIDYFDSGNNKTSKRNEYLIRSAKKETALFSKPHRNSHKIKTIYPDDSILIMISKNGDTPVEYGFVPCRVVGITQEKGWVIAADFSKGEPNSEFPKFVGSFISSIFAFRTFKDLGLSSLITSIICVVLAPFLGRVVAHYTNSFALIISVITLILKYTFFGIGIVSPAFIMLEATVIFAVSNIVTHAVSEMWLKTKLSKISIIK